MANLLYNPARAAFARAEIDWTDAGITVRAQLVDQAAYSVNASHEFLASITAPARVGSPVDVTGRVVTAEGGCDANDLTFSTVSGPSAEAVVLYIVGASDADSKLIAYIDQATGLPVTPNTGDIRVVWAETAAKIFRL